MQHCKQVLRSLPSPAGFCAKELDDVHAQAAERGDGTPLVLQAPIL